MSLKIHARRMFRCLDDDGDRVRLADTESHRRSRDRPYALRRRGEIRRRKVIRDGMGQSPLRARRRRIWSSPNALILDHWGIVKADVAIKDGASVASARPAIR